jgi:hypothetical protein
MSKEVAFPRELREAVPDHQPSVGRCLKARAQLIQTAAEQAESLPAVRAWKMQ